MRIICWLRSIWWTMNFRTRVDGHTYVAKTKSGPLGELKVLGCTMCGYEIVGWKRGYPGK